MSRFRGLGKGGRTGRRRRFVKARPVRSVALQRVFVPRTMGPFAQTESKYFDSFLSAAGVPESTDWTATEIDPAAANTLFFPSEGADINNRVGRKVSVYKIALRGVIAQTASPDKADIEAQGAFRMILYIDTQSNGGQAQGEEVMAPPGAATVPLTFSTFQSTANFGRFRVLKDKIFYPRDLTAMTDGASTASMNAADIPFSMKYSFKKPVEVRYNGSTTPGVVGDIVDNSFHLLMQKSTALGTHLISYQCRTYYKDK